MDEKEFELIKKISVEITKNQLSMQKQIIRLKQDNLDLLNKLKEVTQATTLAIHETRDLILKQRNLDNIALAA